MPEKLPPGSSGTLGVHISTNVYGLKIYSDLKVYRYDVRIKGVIKRGDHEIKVDFTGPSKGE